MQKNHDTKNAAIHKLTDALLKAFGSNDPCPTLGEIDAHKGRAEQRLKYQNLKFADHATQ